MFYSSLLCLNTSSTRRLYSHQRNRKYLSRSFWGFCCIILQPVNLVYFKGWKPSSLARDKTILDAHLFRILPKSLSISNILRKNNNTKCTKYICKGLSSVTKASYQSSINIANTLTWYVTFKVKQCLSKCLQYLQKFSSFLWRTLVLLWTDLVHFVFFVDFEN